jgi:membrane protein
LEAVTTGFWKDTSDFLLRFVKVVWRESVRDTIPTRAASLTFATMLTMIPVLIIVFNVFQLFGGSEWFDSTVRPFILNNLAPGTGDDVATRLEEIITHAGGFALNGTGVLVLVIAVWSIFSGIEGTVNAIWGTRSSAGSLKRLPLYWGLITIVPILLVGSLAITTYLQAVPFINETVGHLGVLQTLFNRAVSAGMIILGLFLFYEFVPNTHVGPRYALASAAIVGLLYEILKSGFVFYTTNLVQYNLIYGSLAAIPLLLIWVNLSWILVLAGVEMTFVQQHYKTLSSQSKGLKMSKTQRNVLGYMLLYEATKVFQGERGERKNLSPVMWGDQYEIPPGLIEATVDKLQQGGLVERVGSPPDQIILARSPVQISVAEMDAILMSEMRSEWEWPEHTTWQWLRKWMDKRQSAALTAVVTRSLADLVEEIDMQSEVLNLLNE